MKNDTLKGQYRINEQIRAKEVRIVSDDIEPKVYPIFQALKMAEEKELDLVKFLLMLNPLFVVLLIILNFFIN